MKISMVAKDYEKRIEEQKRILENGVGMSEAAMRSDLIAFFKGEVAYWQKKAVQQRDAVKRYRS